jgi:hypothetical protein
VGHLPIGDATTFGLYDKNGAAHIRATVGKKNKSKASWIFKEIASMFADALAARAGDAIFPWVTKQGNKAAFHTEFTVADRARFVLDDPFPIRIPVSPKHIRYDPGLPEHEALDLWQPRLLWNAIGKKSLGLSRGLSHQLIIEDAELRARLNATGAAAKRTTKCGTPDKSGVSLKISTTNRIPDLKFEAKIVARDKDKRLGASDPTRCCWCSGDRFRFEKALEAWIMENYDTALGASLREALEIPDAVPIRALNYLPFGVAGKNIDAIIEFGNSGSLGCLVVELKLGSLSAKPMQQAEDQVNRYAKYIADMYPRYGLKVRVVPVVISAGVTIRALPSKSPDVVHVAYNVDLSGAVVFRRQ